MTDELTGRQREIMLVLLSINKEVSNSELRDIAGFTLTGDDRRRLNGLGLIATDEESRPFRHRLTEEGMQWYERELTAQPPPKAGVLGAALYLHLDMVRRFLAARGLNLAEFALAAGAHGDSPDERPSADVATQVREAYRKLASKPGVWVGLAELRPLVSGADRSEVDAKLREMSRLPDVHLVPEANRKALSKADHDAALSLGDGVSHLISIEQL